MFIIFYKIQIFTHNIYKKINMLIFSIKLVIHLHAKCKNIYKSFFLQTIDA